MADVHERLRSIFIVFVTCGNEISGMDENLGALIFRGHGQEIRLQVQRYSALLITIPIRKLDKAFQGMSETRNSAQRMHG